MAISIWRSIFLIRAGGRVYLADLKEITGRLLKKDPRSFDGLRFSGNIALAQNDTAAAILKFEQANLERPDQPDLMLTLVQTLFAARRDQEAEDLASAQIDRQKTFAPLYDALYVHYMRGNRPDLAEQVLRRKSRTIRPRARSWCSSRSTIFLSHRPADARIRYRAPDIASHFPMGVWKLATFMSVFAIIPRLSLQYEEGERQKPEEFARSSRVYRKKMAEVLATQGRAIKAGKYCRGFAEGRFQRSGSARAARHVVAGVGRSKAGEGCDRGVAAA